MYYHILISTVDEGPLYEIDREEYDYIINYIVLPYLKQEPFFFNSYFINPLKIKRIKITKTENDSDYCYQEEKEYMELTRNFHTIDRAYCVTEMSKYTEDITSKAIEEAKEKLPKSPPLKPHPKSVFLAYSYLEKDAVLAEMFKELLKDKGFQVIDGKADKLGSISKNIMDKIRGIKTFIVIMTKRDKKLNEKYTTSSWLLDEKGAALALDKRVVMMVEEEVDERDIGGLQGDEQRFDFNRNNFDRVAGSVIRILDKIAADENASGEEESKQ